MRNITMVMLKISTGAIIAIAATGIFLTLVTSGLLLSSQNMPSGGTLTAVNVGVYSNPACTTNLTSIDWGTVSPNSTTTKTIYVKNTGNVPVTLSMTASGWSPAGVSTYIAQAWNSTSVVLAPNAVATALLTLTITNIPQSYTGFNYNTTITGTE
jgi:hypothetical protein